SGHGGHQQWGHPGAAVTVGHQAGGREGQAGAAAGQTGFGNPQLGDTILRSSGILLNLVAEYHRELGRHTVGILGGVERQTADSSTLTGFRDYFVSSQVDELFAGGDLGKTSSGTAWVVARQTYFSRVNYAFENKYLLELVGRLDGSYIFPPSHRFGFFPAVSLGWRISDEPFFRDHVQLFDDLKLRASWGKTGNDRIPAWQYLPTFGFGGGYVFGGTTEAKSIFQTRTANPV